MLVLMPVRAQGPDGERHHDAGVVTFVDSRRRFFYILNPHGEASRFVYRYGTHGPKVGDEIAVSGVLRQDDTRIPVWVHAEFTRLGSRPDLLPHPVTVPIADLVKQPGAGGQGSLRNGFPITVEGQVRSVTQYGDEWHVELTDGRYDLTVIILAQAGIRPPAFVEPRARVQVTGIFECLYDYRIIPGSAVVVNPYLYVARPETAATSFQLVAGPSWWTVRNALMLLYILLGALFASLVWVLSLRHLVRVRSQALAKALSAREKLEIETAAVQRERLRLSYDLHDDLQQLLAGTMCRLKAGINYLGRHDELKALSQFAFAQESVGQTQTSLRHILWELHDSSEGPGTIVGLFNYVARRLPQWKELVHFSVTGEEPAAARRYSGVLLMILQEAVGNAFKYAEARRIDVTLAFTSGDITLTVADDGKGFVPETAARNPSKLGLGSMRLRAKQMSGTFNIRSAPGEGTVVTVRIPISAEEDSDEDRR